MTADQAWKQCSSCKKPIGFGCTYYTCSVSTCNRKRSGFVFCSVDCWETHLPMMRHREAWAEEERAPSREAWALQRQNDTDERPEVGSAKPAESSAPQRRRIAVKPPASEPKGPQEVLVIASRLKAYVRERYGMNTSDAVLEVLSKELRRLCDHAVVRAREDGRKTLLDRDFRRGD